MVERDRAIFWALLGAAWDIGNFIRWRQACERAADAGWTLGQINAVLWLHPMHTVPLGLIAIVFTLGLLFGRAA